MGTIHVADPRVRDLPAPIREAFESSRRAAFELLPDPEVRQTVQQAQRLPAKKSLAKLLDKDPARRHGSGQELAGELASVFGEL